MSSHNRINPLSSPAKIITLLFAAGLLWFSPLNALPKNIIEVEISWLYEEMAPGIKIYEVKPGAETGLWETDNAETLKETPAGEEFPGGKFKMIRGSKKTFVLVYHNTTDEPIYFFAAPHRMNPEKNSLGFKFKCLCVNHIFTAEPGQYWYRVVDLNSSSQVEAKKLQITHTLIRVTGERMERYYTRHKTGL